MATFDRDAELVLGRYALLKLLARGGMGSVYLARAEGAAGFRKPVVVKVIHPHLMGDPSAVRSFVREAKLAARLVHPNIVQVLDFGEHAGQYLTVLEYVHGHDLAVLVRYLTETGRPLSVEHGAFVVHEVLRGLEFAHGLGDESGRTLSLVHRDISPQNVLFSVDGQVKLTDFGVARVTTEVTGGKASELVGKLAYMAPEQVSGGEVDLRTDLFAVGVVLFEVLTGSRLFASDHEAQTIMRVSRADVPDPRTIRPDLPAGTRRLLRRALARDPADRYPDASVFAADLRALLGGVSMDEVAPTFREMVGRVVAEPGFGASAGALVELTRLLDGPPLPLSTPARGRTAHAAPGGGTERGRGRKRVGTPTLVALGAVVSLLAAGSALVWLRSTGGQPGGGASRQVAVIIDRHAEDGGGPQPSDDPTEEAGPDATAPDEGGPAGLSSPLRPLTGRTVTRTLMRSRPALRTCFRRHPEAAAGAHTVHVRLEIESSGAVRGASVEPAAVGSSPLGACLAQVATRTRFPRHPDPVVAFRVPMRVEQDTEP